MILISLLTSNDSRKRATLGDRVRKTVPPTNQDCSFMLPPLPVLSSSGSSWSGEEVSEGKQRRSSNHHQANNINEVLKGGFESYGNQRASFSIRKYPCLALSGVFCSNCCIFRSGYSFLRDPALKLPRCL